MTSLNEQSCKSWEAETAQTLNLLNEVCQRSYECAADLVLQLHLKDCDKSSYSCHTFAEEPYNKEQSSKQNMGGGRVLL